MLKALSPRHFINELEKKETKTIKSKEAKEKISR